MIFDYQAHTVQTQRAKKAGRAGGQKSRPNLFRFVFLPEHRKLAFSNTGLVFDVFLAPVQVALSNMTHTCC